MWRCFLMQNKKLINKMKNAAELAWAAYGYYHLATTSKNQSFIELKKENSQIDSDENFIEKEITLIDIMDSTYKNYEAHCFNPPQTKKKEKIGKLDGDMTPTQAKRFFERYDILIHQPNTESGFSATLFGEKRKQTNTESKEKSYTNQYGYVNYILAIRGTEFKESIK